MATTTGNRIIYYVTDFDNLTPLKSCAQNGYLTHALVGLFHLGYDDESKKTGPYVHLNDYPPDDSRYDDLWQAVSDIQSYGVKVMGSLGGGGVGDYGNLFASYTVFYPLLKGALQTHDLDGLDLDIEEDSVTTADVQKLVDDLRNDFKNRAGGFLITSAPVASALTGGGSVSAGVDYNQLLSQFDWYNIQFYNNWGDLENGSDSQPPNYNPNYEGVVNACGSQSVNQLVAGALTNGANGGGYIDLSQLSPIISALAGKYSNFGGADGWNYHNALPDPITWAQTISNAVNSGT